MSANPRTTHNTSSPAPCVLYRDRGSIAAALGYARGTGPRLGTLAGRAAIFQFLRVSLRAMAPQEGPPIRPRINCGPAALLSQATIGEWLGAGGRDVPAALERPEPRGQESKVNAYRAQLLWVYFGCAPAAAHRAREAGAAWPFVHRDPMPEGLATACLNAALRATQRTTVEAFVRHYFADAAEALPAQPIGAIAAVAAPTAATAATAEAPPAELHHAVGLDSLKPRSELGRVHVSTRSLPTRHAQLQVLQRAATVRPQTGGATPSHGMVVVSGPIGIGKSEFIFDWLLGLRDADERPFDDVLLMTHCAQLAEDVVAEQIMSYLDRPGSTPLIVLDGLRIENEALQWKQAPRLPSNDLMNLLASQIGVRPFVAVLGVQTPPTVAGGLPRRWLQHPRNPAVLVAEEVRLQPLSQAEARSYARALLAHRQPRDEQVEAVVAWSGGLPLLLSAASVLLASRGELNLPAPAPGGTDELASLRATLLQLNESDGQHYATMRLVSLFRRPLPPSFIQSVVMAVRGTGLSIGRVDAATLLDHFHRSPFFSQGPEGRVELHDGAHWVVEQELAQTLRTDARIAREVRTIHLVASRQVYAQMLARQLPAAGDGAPTLATQYDLELACDCVHHLLGTRCTDDQRTPVPWPDDAWVDTLPARERNVFSGMATQQQIEQFCSHMLGKRNLVGSAFSSRGLFTHKLELLARFIEPWPDGPVPQAQDAALQRTVRYEYAACAIAAGQLQPAERQLLRVLDALDALERQRTAIYFGATDRKRRSHADEAADFCYELAKVSAAHASVLMRTGRVAEVAPRLRRINAQVVVPALEWARGLGHGESFNRQLRVKTLRAHSRLLVRLAEAEHLASAPWVRQPGTAGPFDAALALFDHAIRHQVEIGDLDIRGEALGIERMLGGESARAHVRCLVAAAQCHGRHGPQGQALLQRAHAQVDLHLAALATTRDGVGWSNDAIGFRLLKAALHTLDGQYDEAGRMLQQVEANPKYRNLGATSLPVKFEVRLTRAKLAMARHADGHLDEAHRADLQALQGHAADAQHRLIQMDALLLLAIAGHGSQRTAPLTRARAVCERCPSYRARDDVFQWLEAGDGTDWTLLTIAG
ncbi:MAG: hypothetical protein HY855_05335 [Burkholderiales bacterium]|nr:hypothetical protein [Burkholderiales bacterium]